MPHFLYCNGDFHPDDAPVLRAQDRGFRFGDGVFETIRVENGVPYQWDFHLARLRSGLAALHIAAETQDLRAIVGALLVRNDMQEALVRIGISRGVGSRGYLPLPGATPTRVIETIALPPLPDMPLRLWYSSHPAISPDTLPSYAKLAQGLPSTLARLEAQEHGCDDALRVNAQGELCETASANIFWRAGGVLHTPSLECGVLPGTIREAVLRLSPWPVKEGRFEPRVLWQCEGVFITNVALLAAPVSAVKPKGWRWTGSDAIAGQMTVLLREDIYRAAEECY